MMVVKASELKASDVVLVKGVFPYLAFPPFDWLWRFLTEDYQHIFMVYGKNERGIDLTIESVRKSGPAILPLARHFGSEIEVYRVNHPLADVFSWATLAAGDEIVKRIWTFFDFFLSLPRLILTRMGFSGRIGKKYYPCYFCSELLQIMCEGAPRFIPEALIKLGRGTKDCQEIINIYQQEILAFLPRARFPKNKIRLITPRDLKNIPFFKKIAEGKLVDA